MLWNHVRMAPQGPPPETRRFHGGTDTANKNLRGKCLRRLYKLNLGEVVVTQPTIGSNVEEVVYKGAR